MSKIKKLAGVVLCMSLFAALSLGSGSDTSAEKVGEVSTSSESGAASTTETSATSENTTQTEYTVGEILKYNGLYVTYVKSENYTSDNQFIQPEEGKKFIRLEFYVENQSDSDKTVSNFSFNCYADGYECDQQYFDDAISCTLSTGRTGKGAVYFEVPSDAEKIEVEYEYDWLSSKKVNFIFEGDKDSGFVPDTTVTASENAFKVGDIVETDDLRITYLKTDEYTGYSQYFGPDEGMKYIYIELEFENISDSDQTVTFYSFQCYADGVQCDGYYGMDDALSATMSAGRKAKGTVAFSVPENAEVVEVEYEDNVWTSSKILFSVR